MTISESDIYITGNLEGLPCSESNISRWIQSLLSTEESLEKLISKKVINFSFVSKIEIQELNRRFSNKDKPTNVLSFPSPLASKEDLLGDIAICPEIIKVEAHDQKKSEINHLTHIILHSVLHLAGFDHEEEDSAAKMELLEIKALQKIGIANPY